MTKNKQITSNDEKNNNRDAKLLFATGILLLGAFFAINPSSLNAFADVEPSMLNFTTGEDGAPIHPGDDVFLNKNVTMNTTITPLYNVTWNVYNEGTDETCGDLANPDVEVLHFTTTNQTTLLNSGNHSSYLLFDETFVGMPGTYHCTTMFEAVNATDSANRDFLGNQTVWIDAIGSKGFWKNHPDATAVHLPILLGNQTLDSGMNNVTTSFNVTTPEEATDLLQKHKGKKTLNRLAGQLLTAKLNIWALEMDNDKVGCIDGNVTKADELLRDNNWNGPEGDKLFPDKADRRDVLKVHKWLDTFNNYGCPLED